MAGNQGLGSDNMDDKTKQKIHSMGGKASRSGNAGTNRSEEITTNRSGGGALEKEAQRKGGRNSHQQ